MKLHELSDNAGAHKARMRIGRGIGSGKGKTGGRGGKGQTARSGVRIKGFEGGQMPLHRRLPKRGFDNSPFALKLNEINLGRLQAAIDAGKLDAKSTINAEALVKAGVMRRARAGVRLLGTGELKAKIDIEVYGASKSAQAAVEKAGGSVKILALKKEPSEPKGKNALAALGKGKSKGKAAEGKTSEGKASEGKASEGKASEGKTSEGKAAEGKASEGGQGGPAA